MTPVLVGCSHGTRDPAGRAAIRTILDGLAAARPDLQVREAFVDVQEPEVATVVDDAVAAGHEPVVVVPLLLSGGYHVHVDVAAAAAAHPPGRVVAARPLGPHPLLADVLADRLAAAGVRPEDAVVVAAAGSSDPRAAVDVERVAGYLRERHGGPVSVGYGAGCEPRVPDAVAAARRALPGGGGRVVVASYLLAPGYFHDRLAEAGADVVTAPLAPDERLVRVALDRWEDAQRRATGPVLRGAATA